MILIKFDTSSHKNKQTNKMKRKDNNEDTKSSKIYFPTSILNIILEIEKQIETKCIVSIITLGISISHVELYYDMTIKNVKKLINTYCNYKGEVKKINIKEGGHLEEGLSTVKPSDVRGRTILTFVFDPRHLDNKL